MTTILRAYFRRNLGGTLIKVLQATHTVEAVPAKRPGPARAKRPVTARIRRQEEGQGEATVAELEAAVEPGEEAEEPPPWPTPVLPPATRNPAAPARFENRRKRYQKWLF